MLGGDQLLTRLAVRGVAVSAIVYGLLHVVLLASLVTFGLNAGGYPLQAVAIAAYGAVVVISLGLAAWSSVCGRTPVGRVLPLLLVVPFLATSLAGAFFSTEALGGVGLSTEYRPYLDDDGAFAWRNTMLAIWMVAVALAANWRGLLVGAMAAQGLALWLIPGLAVTLPPSLLLYRGVPPDLLPLLAVPTLYMSGALAMGWRGVRIGRVPVVPIALIAVVLAVLTLGNLVGVLYWALILSLPVLAWRLHRWASAEVPPGRAAVAGAGLAVLAVAIALTWPFMGSGGGDSLLPSEGKALGWIGKTVPEDAYGVAGGVLTITKLNYPWLLVAVGIAWVASGVQSVRRLGIRGAIRMTGFSGGLVMLGFAMLFQIMQLTLMLGAPLPVHGFAGALPIMLGERGLSEILYFGYPVLALGLLWLAAAHQSRSGRMWGWLAFGATWLALAAAASLSLGLLAGILQNLELQRQLTQPEYRQAAQLRLALSLPLNAAMAVLGWVVFVSGVRSVRRTGTGSHLSSSAMRRGLASTAGIAVLSAFAFWRLTAIPVAETYPQNGATDVPTNASVIIQLAPGDRNWSPGISARYPDTGERVVQGVSGASRGGGSWFAPKDGWRPNSRVEVQVCCGPFTRSYRFSFTTGVGPSPDVPAPPGPGPAPAPARPATSSGPDD